ncbi:response regulator [Algoriphagus litoralis]|uniref:response regulator n=1 Tax=Algoriphagus litoralis TaxID=2202829 RepID=UPI000DBA6577|nr:response regulator [Algoriphagus litoralis]
MTTASRKKILVLDDDKIQHLLFRKRIALLNFDIDLIFFEDVNSALVFIQSNSPDIVISDINLSFSDGWQFLDQLEELNFQGKFFLLSGSIHPGDRARALEDARISGFFEKPLLEPDLHYILGT